jgi:hypothetical protein
MGRALMIAGLAAAATLGTYSAPASAWHWVTYNTKKECGGLNRPCELYVPGRFNPAKDKNLKAFQRAEALQFARARQICISRGGKWRMIGENAACGPGGPKRG